MKKSGALFNAGKGGWMFYRLMIFIVSLLLSISGEAFAVGGSLTVTSAPGAVNLSSENPTVELTLSYNVSEATDLNSSGFILQWDADLFALDASSLGVSGDNDPHQTPYLTGKDGTETNDENGGVTHVWKVNPYDTMELRLSDRDTNVDKLFGVPGQAYINYTQTDLVSLVGTDPFDVLKIILKVKSGVSVGRHKVKAFVVAVSDDKGSSASDYVQDEVDIVLYVPTVPQPDVAGFTLDVDGDGRYMPLGDGLLVVRYMFGFSGDALVKDVVTSSATRSSAGDITTYLDGAGRALDVDGNGAIEALGDGLLIVRYMFGFSGTSLTHSVVGAGATRATAEEISSYLKLLVPDLGDDG